MLEWVVVTEQLTKAADLDARLASDRELVDGVLALERARALVDAAEGHLLAELEARGVCDRDVGQSTATWLAHEALLPMSMASSRVKTASVLRTRLCEVDRALVEGRVSWEHARVLARVCNQRVADQVEMIQRDLVGAARGTVFEQWRREVSGIVELLDADGGHDPAGDVARNTLHLTPTIDGVTHLAGMLIGEHATVARQAIDAVADELFRSFARDSEHSGGDVPVPSRSILRELAFAELCRRGLANDLESTAAPRPDVTLLSRRADLTVRSPPTARCWVGPRLARCAATPTCTGGRGQPRNATRPRPEGPARQRRPAPRPRSSRRRVRLPRVRGPHLVDRRAPCEAVQRRGPLRHCEPGVAVPAPSRRDAPRRLVHAARRRWLVHLDHTERAHDPLPTPPRRESPRRASAVAAQLRVRGVDLSGSSWLY